MSLFKKKESKLREVSGSEFVVRWDGSSTIADPVSYFAGSERIQRHVDYLKKVQERLESDR